MTELLFQDDSYGQEFYATVTAAFIEEAAIALDCTAFYAGGGGQPCDVGRVGDVAVTKVIRHEGEIRHILACALPPIGDRPHCQLDWVRLYRLMRTHTAMHVLCGVVFRDYGALVTGGDMEPLRGRMDFESPRLQKDLVSVIEAAVNREIQAARQVVVRVLPRDEAFQIPDLIRTKINLLPPDIQDVRAVEIVGLVLQADGGAPVRNTQEVGRIRVIDNKSKGANNKRLYVELDGS